MKITIPNCEPLVLPAEIISLEAGKFDGKTSYASKLVTRLKQKSYREMKLPAKLECLRILKDRAQKLDSYKSYFEPLAGVGLAARLFAPQGLLWLNDMDEGCRKVLLANFQGVVTGEDALTMKFPKADLTFLDFNDFTFTRYLKGTYKEPLERAFKSSKKFVILNDCSPFYFRYGKGSFEAYSRIMGQPIHSVEDYFLAARGYYRKEYGWWMTHVAFFRESSFQLFYKEVSPFIMSKVEHAPPITVSEGLLS